MQKQTLGVGMKTNPLFSGLSGCAADGRHK